MSLLLFFYICSVFRLVCPSSIVQFPTLIPFLSICFVLICFSSLPVMFSVFRYVLIVYIHLHREFLYKSSKMVHKTESTCSVRCLIYFSFVLMSLAICDDATTSPLNVATGVFFVTWNMFLYARFSDWYNVSMSVFI